MMVATYDPGHPALNYGSHDPLQTAGCRATWWSVIVEKSPAAARSDAAYYPAYGRNGGGSDGIAFQSSRQAVPQWSPHHSGIFLRDRLAGGRRGVCDYLLL